MNLRSSVHVTVGSFLLEERENEICMYREQLCVHKKLLATIENKSLVSIEPVFKTKI